MDPPFAPGIEASGEHVDLAGLTADPVQQVTRRFQELGFSHWIDGGRRRRVFSDIETPSNSSCLTRPDTILIRQHVAAAGPDGYRVSIEASQGNRRYSASLTRSHTVVVLPPGRRLGLSSDRRSRARIQHAVLDVARDLHRLSTPLVDHIFTGAAS